MTHIEFRPHILQLSWYSLKEIPPCVQKLKKRKRKKKENKHYKVYKYSKYFYLEYLSYNASQICLAMPQNITIVVIRGSIPFFIVL